MLGETQEQHVMVLERTHPTGAEEWYCPTCGRRMLLHWPPNYKKVILAPGDENAIHHGGKGGLVISQTKMVQEREPAEAEDSYLAPWLDWMERVNFDSWWD